jgi:hypothetical protein
VLHSCRVVFNAALYKFSPRRLGADNAKTGRSLRINAEESEDCFRNTRFIKFNLKAKMMNVSRSNFLLSFVKNNWLLLLYAIFLLFVMIARLPSYSSYTKAEEISGEIRYIANRATGIGSRQIIEVSGQRFDCFVYWLPSGEEPVCPTPNTVSEGTHVRLKGSSVLFSFGNNLYVISSSVNYGLSKELTYFGLLVNNLLMFILPASILIFLLRIFKREK